MCSGWPTVRQLAWAAILRWASRNKYHWRECVCRLCVSAFRHVPGLQRWQQWKGKESWVKVWTHRSESLLGHYSCLRSCVRVRLTRGRFVTINPDDQLDCAEQHIGDYSSPNPSLSVSLSHQLEPRWNKRGKERIFWYSLSLSLYPTSFCFSLLPGCHGMGCPALPQPPMMLVQTSEMVIENKLLSFL